MKVRFANVVGHTYTVDICFSLIFQFSLPVFSFIVFDHKRNRFALNHRVCRLESIKQKYIFSEPYL